VPATGTRVDFRSMVFNRYQDGVVVENWGLHTMRGPWSNCAPTPSVRAPTSRVSQAPEPCSRVSADPGEPRQRGMRLEPHVHVDHGRQS
jgi:hypothetical protein